MRNIEQGNWHAPSLLPITPEVLKTTFFVLLRVAFGFAWLMAGLTKEIDKHWFSQPNTFLTVYLTAARENVEVSVYYRWFIEFIVLPHVSVFNYSIPITQMVAGALIMAGLFMLPMLMVCLFMHVNFILSGNMNEVSLVLYTSVFLLLLGFRYAERFSLTRHLMPMRASARTIARRRED